MHELISRRPTVEQELANRTGNFRVEHAVSTLENDAALGGVVGRWKWTISSGATSGGVTTERRRTSIAATDCTG
jgi:hypothetical protein